MYLRRTTGASPFGWVKIHLGLSLLRPEVSRLWALSFPMRVGSAVVKVGGIAGVYTHERHRLKGYSRLVMEEAARYFEETGHDLSLLFGLPDLYHRFGFAPVIPDTTVTLRTADARAVLGELSHREASWRSLEESDWPKVLLLYSDTNRSRTGTVVRSEEEWSGYRYGTEWDCGTVTQVIEIGGEVRAFVTLDDLASRCRVADLGFESEALLPLLLEVISSRAEQSGVEEVELELPPDQPFVRFCRRCGCRVTTRFDRNAGGMARIVDLGSLVDKLLELLSVRVHGSEWASRAGVLELRTESSSIGLAIDGRPTRRVEAAEPDWSVFLPQVYLVQLLLGYRSAADVAVEKTVRIEEALIPLLDTLFPLGSPWIASPERF